MLELDACADEDWRFQCYLDAVLSNLTRKVSVAYSLRGCWLANRRTPHDQQNKTIGGLLASADCNEVPLDDIARMSAVFEDYRKFWELSAWEMCGALPGFEQVLHDTPWELLNSNTADHWMAIFSSLTWGDLSDASRSKRWQAIRTILPGWINCLSNLPEARREKYARMLRSYVCNWDTDETLCASLAFVHPLQARLCHTPFAADGDGDCMLSGLVEALSPSDWQQLVKLPDDVWLTVERACKRDNDARLIRYGMSVMAQILPQFTLDTLSNMPQRLMRSCRLLGCLEYERRRQFLVHASRSVWFTTDWASLAPLEACRILLRRCAENDLQSPLPRRLRDYLEAGTTLTEPQIARHCRETLGRLPHVILAAVDKLIWQHIDHPFNIRLRSNAASHAVRFLAGLGSDDNRKVLRRFLLAYSRGDSTAYLRHPLNLAWLMRHPRINADIWNGSTRFEAQTLAGIRIVIETDPLEILMLGTYVGSCLGLGGGLGYSAVACLLDINKQVLYARDAQGRILGRQLVAIDEADLLVCYQIYPSTTNEALQKAFSDFNAAFALALNIELFNREKHDDYYVDTTLSSTWWDDYAL